jgi:hypothetical protein
VPVPFLKILFCTNTSGISGSQPATIDAAPAPETEAISFFSKNPSAFS